MTEKSSQQPWWNSALWGEKSLVEYIREAVASKPVPNETLHHYNQALSQIQSLGLVIQGLDNEKMQEPEFLLFVKIQQQFISSSGYYQGLYNCINLLIKALENRYYLKTLEILENQCTEPKESDFYTLVGKVIQTMPSNLELHKKMQEKFNSIISICLGETVIKQALDRLQSYIENTSKIGQQDQGIELLYVFKKYKSSPAYSSSQSIFFMLEVIVVFLNKYATEDLVNLEQLAKDVQEIENIDSIFQELGKMFGIPKMKNNSDTYIRIIQYLSLRYKYQNLYLQFGKVNELLLQWQEQYQIICELKKQYPPQEYKQPKEFYQNLPGLDLYEKYKDYLNVTYQK